MLIATPNGIPSSVRVDKTSFQTISLYRSSSISSIPKKTHIVSIPTGRSDDFPRSLVASSSGQWEYWENAEIPTVKKQRPPRIKYMMMHPHLGKWYVVLLLSLTDYERKYIEAIDRINLCSIIGINFAGVILITYKKFTSKIDPTLWPLDIAISNIVK